MCVCVCVCVCACVCVSEQVGEQVSEREGACLPTLKGKPSVHFPKGVSLA